MWRNWLLIDVRGNAEESHHLAAAAYEAKFDKKSSLTSKPI